MCYVKFVMAARLSSTIAVSTTKREEGQTSAIFGDLIGLSVSNVLVLLMTELVLLDLVNGWILHESLNLKRSHPFPTLM